jgi:hypothetical protein
VVDALLVVDVVAEVQRLAGADHGRPSGRAGQAQVAELVLEVDDVEVARIL